jgi:peptide/nickel transport system permease protein
MAASTAPVPVTPAQRARAIQLPRSPKILFGVVTLGVFVLLAIVGPWLAPYPAGRIGDPGPTAPSAHHWLGTTNLGQDILSQVLVGARPTLVVSFVAGAIATILSIVVGITAGYVGGLVDDLLSMLANIFLVLPGLPLLIVICSYLPAGDKGNSVLIAAVISLTGWAWGARVLRAQTLSMRRRDFVEAARITGEPTWRIIGFEIMPNLIPIIAASFLFTVLYAIGTYVALGFLGTIDPSANWSWGSMLFWTQHYQAAQVGAWYWLLPPGLCIALVGTSLALINFGIDEFINPRLRAAGLTRKVARRSGLNRDAVRRSGLRQRRALGLTPVLHREPTAPIVLDGDLLETGVRP